MSKVVVALYPANSKQGEKHTLGAWAGPKFDESSSHTTFEELREMILTQFEADEPEVFLNNEGILVVRLKTFICQRMTGRTRAQSLARFLEGALGTNVMVQKMPKKDIERLLQ